MINVLLIEDHDMVRQSLRLALEMAGMSVIEAEDGTFLKKQPEALANIDIVVTDILMPNEDGMEVISSLSIEHPEMPVIAMSGGGRISSKDYLAAAQGLGATAIFHKPFDEGDLIDKIHDVVGHA